MFNIGIRKQKADSANNLQIPLTIYGFRNSSVLINLYFNICLWIPQIVPNSANSPIFAAIFCGTLF